ncbi:MAG: OmpA family protein [Kiloniellaceae bacterium]
MAMTNKQEAKDRAIQAVRRHCLRAVPPVVTIALALALSACAAIKEATQSPEQAAARQPQQVTTEGAKDEFPTLSQVPGEAKPSLAPEDRERLMAQMIRDRDQATFTQPVDSPPAGEPAPLVTAAAPDPFSRSVIISGDAVTTSDQLAGVPLTTAAGGAGQLAAIIFFSHGSSELDAGDRSVLRDIAALHRQRGGRLRVVGHSSSRTRNTTPEEHQIANFDMSLTRAESVQAELLALGVAAGAVRAEAVGDAEPVYHEFMPSGEAGNRRVEIFLEK